MTLEPQSHIHTNNCEKEPSITSREMNGTCFHLSKLLFWALFWFPVVNWGIKSILLALFGIKKNKEVKNEPCLLINVLQKCNRNLFRFVLFFVFVFVFLLFLFLSVLFLFLFLFCFVLFCSVLFLVFGFVCLFYTLLLADPHFCFRFKMEIECML